MKMLLFFLQCTICGTKDSFSYSSVGLINFPKTKTKKEIKKTILKRKRLIDFSKRNKSQKFQYLTVFY